jgi:undecaprenyl-diphosphatase
LLQDLDLAALRLANSPAGLSEGFDWALRLLVGVDLFKMGVPVLLLLWVWLRPDGRIRDRAGPVLRDALGILAALAVGRWLQDNLPPRPRPHAALPDFPFPSLGGLPGHEEWSSFPSDHAVLVFAIATATWAAARRLGLVSTAWATLAVCFPRIYFGYHYPSDILAGALLGAGMAALVARAPVPRVATAALGCVEARVPAVVTLALFVLGYEFLSMFQGTRGLLRAVRDLVHAFG